MYSNRLLLPCCPNCKSTKINAYFSNDGNRLACQCNEPNCRTQWNQKPEQALSINDTRRLDYIEGQLLRKTNVQMSGTYYLSIKSLGKVPMGVSFRELIDDRIYNLERDVKIVWQEEDRQQKDK